MEKRAYRNHRKPVKILVVEDTALKAQRINECVKECDPNAIIFQALNAADAFRCVATEEIDLMLLDVRLPLGANQEPSEEGSIWLLREMYRKLARKKIPLVVGTTQYEDSLLRTQDTFKDYLWSILFVTENTSRWQQQISQAVASIASKTVGGRMTGASEPVDVGIVVALRMPEFERMVDALGAGTLFVLEETNEHWLKYRISHQGGRQVEVIVACADEMGMCSMSGLTTRLVLAMRPKKLILAGIMGGNASRVALGDLIVVEETWDFRAGKITEHGFEADVRSQQCSQRIVNGIREVLTNEMLRQIWDEWSGEKPRSLPQLHIGAVACSPAVISDGRVFDEIETQKRKVLGIEMEAYGCYHSARKLGSLGPEVICIKSVCDLGDSAKTDKYHAFCAYLSARAVTALIKSPTFLDC